MSSIPHASRTLLQCACLRALVLLLVLFFPCALTGTHSELAPTLSSAPVAPTAPADDDTLETTPRPSQPLQDRTHRPAVPLRPAPLPATATARPSAEPLPLPPPPRTRYPLTALRTVVLRC